MKKGILTVVLTIGMIGATFAQMAIPGGIFADNPARFNGRKVTIKNIAIKSEDSHPTTISVLSGPSNIAANGNVGASQPRVAPCRPPRGFEKVGVFFIEKPEFEGCFFMAKSMYDQLQRELGGHNVDAQITFRGDYRTGYNVTFYRLGQ